MAQQTTTMVDDLDDTVTAEETIRFGLDRPGRRPSTRRSAGPVWVQVANRDAAASTRSTDCPPVQVGPRRTPGDQREVTGACFGPFVPVGPSDRSAPGLHPAERAPQLRAARPTPPPSHGRTGLKRTLVLQPHHDSLPRHVPTRSEIAHARLVVGTRQTIVLGVATMLSPTCPSWGGVCRRHPAMR